MYKLLKFNNFWLNKAKILIIILVLMANVPLREASAALNYDDIVQVIGGQPEIAANSVLTTGFITGDNAFVGVDAPSLPDSASFSQKQKLIRVVLTAYSSTSDQTDDTPFITASNTYVRDGIVAANFLDFGTKVRIPEIFGDKVFTVEDRMAKKHSDKIDIWFPERRLAKKFGVQEAEVIVLQ